MFYMLLLEQDTTKKKRVNKKLEIELKASDDIDYEVKAIWDSAVYTKKLVMGYLPGLYYLRFWKGYHKKENTRKPIFVMQHL